jgi:hypothetical protein
MRTRQTPASLAARCWESIVIAGEPRAASGRGEFAKREVRAPRDAAKVEKVKHTIHHISSRDVMGSQKGVVQSFPKILYLGNFVQDSHYHHHFTSRQVILV